MVEQDDSSAGTMPAVAPKSGIPPDHDTSSDSHCDANEELSSLEHPSLPESDRAESNLTSVLAPMGAVESKNELSSNEKASGAETETATHIQATAKIGPGPGVTPESMEDVSTAKLPDLESQSTDPGEQEVPSGETSPEVPPESEAMTGSATRAVASLSSPDDFTPSLPGKGCEDEDEDEDYTNASVSESVGEDDADSYDKESYSDIDEDAILHNSTSSRRRTDYNAAVESELADMPSAAKDIDMDSVRNYGASILAMADNSRVTKRQEKFRPPSAEKSKQNLSSSPVSPRPQNITMPALSNHKLSPNATNLASATVASHCQPPATPQQGSAVPSSQTTKRLFADEQSPKSSSSEDDDTSQFITPAASHDTMNSLQMGKTSASVGDATASSDGLAIERPKGKQREAGVNHFKVTLSKETQLAVQREIEAQQRRTVPRDPADGSGITRRVIDGAGTWLENRRERRRKADMERQMEEANQALEEMRRLSDSQVAYQSDSEEEDLEIQIEPEPPSKYRPVPPILSKELMKDFAQFYLPAAVRMDKWKRLYSLTRDGDSFQTFVNNVARFPKSLIVVRTTREDIMGAYNEASWEVTHKHEEAAKFYGSGQSFLFKVSTAANEDVSFAPMNLENDGAPSALRGTETPAKKERIVIYKWTGANRYIQLCDGHRKLVAMGGGGNKGTFGFCLEDDFAVGSSGPCETFGNEPLASEETFDVLDVEVWGFLSYMF
jgi:hypothetical protein